MKLRDFADMVDDSNVKVHLKDNCWLNVEDTLHNLLKGYSNRDIIRISSDADKKTIIVEVS